jgi:hypothetical protein
MDASDLITQNDKPSPNPDRLLSDQRPRSRFLPPRPSAVALPKVAAAHGRCSLISRGRALDPRLNRAILHREKNEQNGTQSYLGSWRETFYPRGGAGSRRSFNYGEKLRPLRSVSLLAHGSHTLGKAGRITGYPNRTQMWPTMSECLCDARSLLSPLSSRCLTLSRWHYGLREIGAAVALSLYAHEVVLWFEQQSSEFYGVISPWTGEVDD